MNSPVAAATPSLEAATMWPLVSRSISVIRGSCWAYCAITVGTAALVEKSSTMISSQSAKSWAMTDSMHSLSTSTGGS